MGLVALESKAQSWPAVPPDDLARFKPADFNDSELDIPFYLHHFHKLANGVVETGPNKGFINIHVWRNAEGQQTYNARIMENILSLAWFYCTDRPWNIYRGHPALKPRLEAALDFWCRSQNADGKFSEYGPQKWNLPATAFATKFMGEALILLQHGPAIDPQLLSRVIEADRKAIMVVLTDSAFYAHGKNYSNQFTNVWAGGLAYLSLFPDQPMRNLLEKKIRQSAPDFQSPAGFFYEAGGTDFGYNFNTHHSNLWMAYHFSRGSSLAKYFIEEEKKYYEWIRYNVVPEPAGYFTVNRAIETRQKAPVIGSYFVESPLGEAVPGIRAFNKSQEEKKAEIAARRQALEQNWPRVPELGRGAFSSFSPYAFLHRRQFTWNPTAAQKKESYGQLPYIKRNKFVHQKMDSRHPTVFTFVRQPSYYASFNAGAWLKPPQRYGIGLLWHPVAGSFLQSVSDSDSAAWGTKSDGKLYEADTLNASFFIDGMQQLPKPGNQDLKDGLLTVSYALGDKGKKSIRFDTNQLEVSIEHPGIFTEHLPFLLNDKDDLRIENGHITLTKNGVAIRVLFKGAAQPAIINTKIPSGSQHVVIVKLEANDALTYAIEVN
jgi:hypothetical protein